MSKKFLRKMEEIWHRLVIAGASEGKSYRSDGSEEKGLLWQR